MQDRDEILFMTVEYSAAVILHIMEEIARKNCNRHVYCHMYLKDIVSNRNISNLCGMGELLGICSPGGCEDAHLSRFFFFDADEHIGDDGGAAAGGNAGREDFANGLRHLAEDVGYHFHANAEGHADCNHE